MARRISITKRQRETAAATDLIALCQTVTEDGSLGEDEVGAMAQWLIDNVAVDLPAKEFLWATVERVIADGKVTPDERQELRSRGRSAGGLAAVWRPSLSLRLSGLSWRAS